MNNKEIVTILIPTFERSSLLLRAIKSIQNQTYRNLIIYIIDNNSKDDTFRLVKELMECDNRIFYYCHDINIGPIANYSYALGLVLSPYFAYVADDDIIFPNCIEYAIKGLEENKDVVFWGGNTLHVNAENNKIIRGTTWSWGSGGVFSSLDACKNIASGNHLEFQGLVFRTSMVRESNLSFNLSNNLPDVDLEFYLARRYKVGVTNDVTAVMFSHPESASSGRKKLSTYYPSLKFIKLRLIEDKNLIQNKFFEEFKKKWDLNSMLILTYLSINYNKEHNNEIVKILKNEYNQYILAKLLACFVNGFSYFWIGIAFKILFKIFYVIIRPSILLNRLFPRGVKKYNF